MPTPVLMEAVAPSESNVARPPEALEEEWVAVAGACHQGEGEDGLGEWSGAHSWLHTSGWSSAGSKTHFIAPCRGAWSVRHVAAKAADGASMLPRKPIG